MFSLFQITLFGHVYIKIDIYLIIKKFNLHDTLLIYGSAVKFIGWLYFRMISTDIVTLLFQDQNQRSFYQKFNQRNCSILWYFNGCFEMNSVYCIWILTVINHVFCTLFFLHTTAIFLFCYLFGDITFTYL